MSKRGRVYDHVSTSSLGPKRARVDAGPLPPLIFVVTWTGGVYNCYYYDSQDAGKRRRVLDTIVQLSGSDANGPVKASWVLDWVADNLEGDEDEDVPDELKDDVIEAYMVLAALAPLDTEWVVEVDAKHIEAQPRSVITCIDLEPSQ